MTTLDTFAMHTEMNLIYTEATVTLSELIS